MPTSSRKNFARRSRLALSGLVLLSLQFVAGSARGEQAPTRDARDDAETTRSLDLRFSTGFGRGYVQDTTTAYRAGLGADVWMTDTVGVGGEVAYLLQVTALGQATDALIFMPEFAYRTALSAESYLALAFAVGYSRSRVTVRGERVDCIVSCDFDDSPEFEPNLVDSHDLISSVQVGMVEYRGPVFFGFSLRGDVIGLLSSSDVPVHGAMTLNGSFGF